MTADLDLDLDAIEAASETCGLAVMLANLLRVTDHCRALKAKLAESGTSELRMAEWLKEALARADKAEEGLLDCEVAYDMACRSRAKTVQERDAAIARAEAAEATLLGWREAMQHARDVISAFCEGEVETSAASTVLAELEAALDSAPPQACPKCADAESAVAKMREALE